jgi:VWFA-related protein
MRPTPITDLTNDPKRVDKAIDLLMRNYPAFRETALFDSLEVVLNGGRMDTVVLDESRSSKAEYRGLDSVQGKRKAVILIASGLDTLGKSDLKHARKIQNAGVPIYVIGTVDLFKAKLGNKVAGEKAKDFLPGKKDLEQAESQLRAIALETGGAYFPCATNGEVAGILHNIGAMLLGQYSLTFTPDQIRDGKEHQIEVKVDVNGDGVYDEQFVVQARTVYNAPKK